MSASAPATVPVEPALYDALRAHASESGRSVADLVDEAVRVLLAEDAEDLAALDARGDEPTVSLEELGRELRAKGLL